MIIDRLVIFGYNIYIYASIVPAFSATVKQGSLSVTFYFLLKQVSCKIHIKLLKFMTQYIVTLNIRLFKQKGTKHI